MDEIIKEAIDVFSSKLEKAYEENKIIAPENYDEIIRSFIGTDVNFYLFHVILNPTFIFLIRLTYA